LTSGYESSERPAEPGELCTCGRQAVVVYVTEQFGDIGYCGIADGGANAQPEGA
jgi:hypothetical protein